MSIQGNLYMWGTKAKGAPEEPGVYALYDKNRIMIYLGGSSNLRETFCRYQETDFSDDPRKRETVYYRRMSTTNWEEKVKSLLDEYKKDCGDVPKLNTVLKVKEEVTPEWGFYFYEDVNKPLFEAAFNLEDFWEKIEKIPVASLEFHQKRGDFARWIRDVFKETQLAERIGKIYTIGEDLRRELFNARNNPEIAECPECGTQNGPVKTWKMAGRPSKTGERLQLTIGFYRCNNCKNKNRFFQT